MGLPTGIFLLRMVHEFMHIALHRPIAAGRIRIEPTARFYRHVGGPLDRLHRKIFGRLYDDSPLTTDPGDNGVPAVTEQKTTLLLSTALVVSLWHQSA